jgi:DNA-3-methyladenine glycosylase
MRLERSFYERDVLIVAPELISKRLIISTFAGTSSYLITEVEAYRGTEDEASHARFGKTSRNSVMFDSGGLLYVYLIYGMYWMLNIVTGISGQAQAALIRGVSDINGPGRVTRQLGIERSFYGEDLVTSERIWIEDHPIVKDIVQLPRIGINYAGEPWKSQPWRYIMVRPPQIS